MKNLNALSLLKDTYTSDDEDSTYSDRETDRLSPKKSSVTEIPELPVPETLLNFLTDEPENSETHDDQQSHNGRIRSFPHERGNWATSLYVPIRNETSINTLRSKLLSYVQTIGDFHSCDDFHVSFSRTVVLRHHWIQLFVGGVRKDIEKCERFPIDFDELEVFVNDERTRTFLALKVSLGCHVLSQLVKCADQNLSEFNLPRYYENPSFHASILWCVGDHEKELVAMKPMLQKHLDELRTRDPELLRDDVDEVHCKAILCILRLCDAIFLVKFGSVVHHYRHTMGKFSGHDPLGDASRRDWEIICDSIIKAKQFTSGYYDSFRKVKIRPRVELREWDPAQNFVWDEEQFSYRERRVRTKKGVYGVEMVKSLQCLCTTFVKWFVTYGGEGGYMYLFEPGVYYARIGLRVTGLFEPSAKFKDKDVSYFFRQLRRTVTRENMLQATCDLSDVNRLRLCSCVYDALSKKGRLEIPQRNIIDLERGCTRRVVIERNKFRGTMQFLPCATIVTEDDHRTEYSKISFYVLADALERGAVFVFFERNDEKLELRARITRIGALLHPVKRIKRKNKANAEDGDEESEEELGKETEEEMEDRPEESSRDEELDETSDQKT